MKPTRNTKGRAPLFLVGVDAVKDTLAAPLRIGEPGPGFVHFAADLLPEYFRQLTSEMRVRRFVRGRVKRTSVPKKDRARNETWDTLAYATAALNGLYSLGFKLENEAQRMEDIPMRQGGCTETMFRP